MIFNDSDSDSDDLFGPPAMPETIKSNKSDDKIDAIFGGLSSSDEDDLFSSSTKNARKTVTKLTAPSKNVTKTNLFEDSDDDDDIFSLATKKTGK